MDIGTLVKEKEGDKSCGIILEDVSQKIIKSGHFVKVLWPSGKKTVHKITFLEEMYKNEENT